MGMSVWGLLAAPLMAHSPAPATTAIHEPLPIAAPGAAGDLFSDLSLMDENAMRDAAGGANVAADIQNLGVNIAENDGDVRNVETNGDTGEIANNVVTDNRGFTTVFNNTGNGVIFQSIVNVNIYTGATN